MLIIVKYSVDESQLNEFFNNMEKLKDIRQRNGGYRWSLFKDLENPDLYTEHFLVENWQEHEPQHAGTSESEKAIHDATFSCLKDSDFSLISHMIYINLIYFNLKKKS